MAIKAKKVSASLEELLDPTSGHWSGVAGEKIELAATPLANQPSEYIKASRDEKKIGKVRELEVKCCHNGTQVFLRLEWADEARNLEVTETNTFPDGAGVLFPIKNEPPIDEMGRKEDRVNAWYWRADFADQPKNVWAEGLITTSYSEESFIKAKSRWENGKWQVVLARNLAVGGPPDESVKLEVGRATKVGFAIWEGGNGERAGVKSFSKEWRDFELEA